jgi:hypothetical protein
MVVRLVCLFGLLRPVPLTASCTSNLPSHVTQIMMRPDGADASLAAPSLCSMPALLKACRLRRVSAYVSSIEVHELSDALSLALQDHLIHKPDKADSAIILDDEAMGPRSAEGQHTNVAPLSAGSGSTRLVTRAG